MSKNTTTDTQTSLDDLKFYDTVFLRLSATYKVFLESEEHRRSVDELRRKRISKYGLEEDTPESLQRDILFAAISAEIAYWIEEMQNGFDKMAEHRQG